MSRKAAGKGAAKEEAELNPDVVESRRLADRAFDLGVRPQLPAVGGDRGPAGLAAGGTVLVPAAAGGGRAAAAQPPPQLPRWLCFPMLSADALPHAAPVQQQPASHQV